MKRFRQHGFGTNLVREEYSFWYTPLYGGVYWNIEETNNVNFETLEGITFEFHANSASAIRKAMKSLRWLIQQDVIGNSSIVTITNSETTVNSLKVHKNFNAPALIRLGYIG